MPKLETAGYRGIWPVRVFGGYDFNGKRIEIEGYRNMVTGEVEETGDWNKDPSFGPTGDILRHGMGGSQEFWDAMAKQKDNYHGRVIVHEPGRTVISYG